MLITIYVRTCLGYLWKMQVITLGFLLDIESGLFPTPRAQVMVKCPGSAPVSDPGKGHAPPPLFLDQTEARRARKKCVLRPPPSLSQGLDDRPPSLPLI